MTDPVECERCGKPGARVLGQVSPDGWFFGCFTLGEEGDHDPGDFLVVQVCSAECRDAMWRQSSGQRWSDIEHTVHHPPDELRRAARKHIERLARDIARIQLGSGACSIGSKFAEILKAAVDTIDSETESQIDALSEDHP